MGLVAALSGLLVKALGRIATAAFGWAATLLFGRQPRERELILSAITLASLAWVATVVGVVWPEVGLFLIALVPLADLLPPDVARLLMLVVAVLLPAVVGVALATVGSPAAGLRGRLAAIGRGYLVTPLLAVVVAWLAAYGIYRRVRFATSGWSQVHLPLVIAEGRTDEVAATAVAALGRAGVDVTSGEPDQAVGRPAAWLARAAGRGGGDAGGIGRAVVLRGPDLEVALYPFDAALAGSREAVARARAALALALSDSPAHLTMAPEAQRLEDAIRAARTMDHVRSAAALRDVDARLAAEPYESSDWDVLARLRFAAGPGGPAGRAVSAGPAAPVARPGAPDEAVPAAGEATRADARWLGVAALTIVANTLLVLGSVVPRVAALAGADRRGRRRAG